jgi:hypothetical protein
LLHEGEIYRRIEKIQGAAIPVYLGNIDLLEWYNLDLGVRILHMLLLSWGGEVADEDKAVKGMAGIQEEIQRTVAEVRRAGVDQMDIRLPNLLWNQEAQRVILIDFERAIEVEARDARAAKKRAMQKISPNKRRKRFKSPIRGTRRKTFLV